MSYLDSFMRPNYQSDPGILGLYQFVQQGYDAGKARGQNQAIAQLSQKAYTDTGPAQQQDIAQMIGIDPQAGYQQAAISQQQQQQVQAQKLAQLQRLGKGASGVLTLLQQGKTAEANGLYQSMLPDIRLASAQHGGPEPSATLDQTSLGALTKLAAVYASLPVPQKGVVVSQGGAVVNPTTGVQMYRNPAAPKITPQGYQAVLGPDGTYHAAQIPIQGAQNGMGMGAAVPGTGAGAAPNVGQAAPASTVEGAPPGTQVSEATGPDGQRVQFAFAPGTPDAVQSQAGAMAGIPQGQPQQGAPQTLAQAVAAGKGGAGRQAPSGYQWNASHTGLEPIPGGPADKGDSFQGESSAALFGDPTLRGAQYVQSIPEGNREIVKGLLDGTVPMPTGTALKNPLWQSALASVKHADPAWNQAAYKQYANTRKFFTIGQGGQLINSINTAAQHLDKLREDIAALNNGNLRPLNAIGNYLSAGTGGQAVTNFEADLTPVASELAAVYKGKGVPSDEEIRHFREALTPNMSYGQQMNVIRGWIDLLAGKLNATREQYRGSMSKLSSPLSVINPHAAEALERITTLANEVSNTGQRAMPAQDTTPIYAPGGQQPASGADAPTGVDALLSKYGIQ